MEIKDWFAERGDETLALDWPLNENSHVWEIGGYMGRWAKQIHEKYNCHVTIFEPQMWAVERMHRYFDGNDKIEIRPYGLWTEDAELPIGNFETDGASIVNIPSDKPVGMGNFVDFQKEVSDFKPDINLCLMNIEGAEFTLIPNFVVSCVMRRFENFWCQFHTINDPQGLEAPTIFHLLELTHEMIWNCYPTAVAWRKR